MQQSIVTLTTDFGLSDHFVGTMKGVMLTINPAVQFVDISHQVSSYDIFDGAFTIAQAYRYFPIDSIHLIVVDPGVGSSRRPILVSTRNYKFVAPDNGVLSLIYERRYPELRTYNFAAPDNGVLSLIYEREEGAVVRHI